MANIEASVSGDWHTGSNWVGGIVPTATDVAILNGKVMTIAPGESVTCSSIEGGTALESLVSAIKAKTDQFAFTNGAVNANPTGGNYVTESITASTNGYWDAPTTWIGGVVPSSTSFVYTNGKAITVNGTVECAGVADTTETGGLIIDLNGDAALKAAYGDSGFSSVIFTSTLNGDFTNSGSVVNALSGTISDFSTDSVGGNTSVWTPSKPENRLTFTMPLVTNSESVTLEFMYKPTVPVTSRPTVNLIGYNTSLAVKILDPQYNTCEFSAPYGGSPFGSRGVFSSNVSALSYTEWNHIVVQRIGTTVTIYINGTISTQYTVSSSYNVTQAFAWKLQVDRGKVAHFRFTKNYTRYSGTSFAIPALPYPTYAPAPGSTLSGRLVLGTNGAVIQSGNNPTTTNTGVLKTLVSKIFNAEDSLIASTSSIKAKTDQLDFTTNGIVIDGGTSATDYTDDLQQIKNLVVAGLN